MRRLIPRELKRLAITQAFAPNVHAQWLEEESQRAFLEWCRKDEERELVGELPAQESFSFWRLLNSFIP